MKTLKSIFPFSFGSKGLIAFLIRLLIYILIGVVLGFVISLISSIPVIGLIGGILGWCLEAYCLVGVVLLILAALKIIK